MVIVSLQPDAGVAMRVAQLVLLCAAASIVACGSRERSAADAPAPAPASTPSSAVAPPPADAVPPADVNAPAGASAQLTPTQGNTASGTLELTATGDGVRIAGTLQGLRPNGEFGFHIHEKGDCSSPDASSAGGHFNPANAPHGDPHGTTHHAGDLPSAKSDASGNAQVDAVATGVNLASGDPGDVHGKAIVVHEKPDDYKTQPSGNSGARIACGVIH
jgi:Cu-Zn family superoxide dismutase